MVVALLEAFRDGGAQGYWRKRLETMDALGATSPIIHYPRAIVHRYLGQTEEALHHVERMVENHVGGVRLPWRRSALWRRFARIRAIRRRSGGWGWARSVGLQKRIQRRHNRHRHASRSSATNDRPLERFNLDPLSLRQDRSAMTIASCRESRRRMW